MGFIFNNSEVKYFTTSTFTAFPNCLYAWTVLTGILNEWGETDVDPMDLFRCPGNCYDVNNISTRFL